MSTIGERIRKVRIEVLEIKQGEMADRLGTSLSLVSKYETGVNKVPNYFIRNLCTQYGINEQWLRTGEGPIHADAQPTDMEKLEAIMSGKSEVKKNFIRALADMPEALLDEMLPYLRKAVAELDRR